MCLTINILITALTSYQKDIDYEYENEILKIILNYARGSMIFDVIASIPALFIDQNS